jgi:hypothetical protein
MCAGKQTGLCWEKCWLVYAGEHTRIDVCREANWFMLGSSLLCTGRQIIVYWESDWCIIGSRSVCTGKQVCFY